MAYAGEGVRHIVGRVEDSALAGDEPDDGRGAEGWIISEGRRLLRRQRNGGRPTGADRTLETERRERLGDRAHSAGNLAANGVERQRAIGGVEPDLVLRPDVT